MSGIQKSTIPVVQQGILGTGAQVPLEALKSNSRMRWPFSGLTGRA